MAGTVWFHDAVRRGGSPEASSGGRAVDEHTFQVLGVPTILSHATAGPADVRGLRRGAISRRVPHPGDRGAEEEQRPYVELAETDLPWRYSPGKDAQGHVHPWLMLLVAPAERLRPADGWVAVPPDVQASHPVADAYRWAHVQQMAADDAPELGVARVLAATQSWAAYLAETDHVAALVVPWLADGRAAWPPAPSGDVRVRCLDSWTFRTGTTGTFYTLATELHHADHDPVGSVQVDVPRGGRVVTLHVGGALTSLDDPAPTRPTDLDHRVLARGQDLGRQVVGPPVLGGAWTDEREVRRRARMATNADEPTWAWPEQANADLRQRVAAAVGTQAGIDLQEEIVRAARRAWGSGPAASALLSWLALGLAATRSGWRRRVAGAGPEQQLRLLGPAAGRLPARDAALDGDADAVGTVRHSLAHPGVATRAPYAIELLGPLARRVVRPGGPVTRHAQPGAARPTTLMAAAVRVEEVPDRPRDAVEAGADPDDLDPGHADTAAQDLGDQRVSALGALRESVRAQVDLDELNPRGEPASRQLLDLGRLADLLTSALDPTGRQAPAVRRVASRITGVEDDRLLLPLEDCPDLDLPAWRYLRDHAPHWLLPGAETLAPGEVAALRTNPPFCEAFLLGVNQQALGELRWRQQPVRAGCTPLRRFWERYDQLGEVVEDIVGIARWQDPDGAPIGRLGDHPGEGAVAERLVVVIRSDLFRLYPRTLVSLARDVDDEADLQQRDWPSAITQISPDLTMFAFDLDPEEVRSRWLVVEEVPDGMRFRVTGAGVAPSSGAAAWAAALVIRPLRVLLRGSGTVVRAPS